MLSKQRKGLHLQSVEMPSGCSVTTVSGIPPVRLTWFSSHFQKCYRPLVACKMGGLLLLYFHKLNTCLDTECALFKRFPDILNTRGSQNDGKMDQFTKIING